MAAGLGYKEFTTGDVLTAADANGYLASQVVMVFADAAARTAAIASPQEGMVAYLKDTNSTEYYSGSAWVAIGGSGASMTLINTGGTTLTGASTTVGSIPTTYNRLIVYTSGVANASANYELTIQPNGSANLVYALISQNVNNIANTDKITNADLKVGASFTQGNTNNSSVLIIDNYASASVYKPVNYSGFAVTTAGDLGFTVSGGIKTNTAITSLKFNATVGTFSAGTVLVYGVK